MKRIKSKLAILTIKFAMWACNYGFTHDYLGDALASETLYLHVITGED